MAIIGKNGLWFKDGPLSHRQLEILFLVAQFPQGTDRKELTEDLHDRHSRARSSRGESVLSDSQRASLSRSIKRLIDAGLVQRVGNQLCLTEGGRQFMDALRQDPALDTYLKCYAPTWSKRAQRAAGVDDGTPRKTLEEAEQAISRHWREKYNLG